MILENDLKLDYADVLIRPKRSKLRSRSDVDLVRDMNFKSSEFAFSGIPIMAANMDGVGTFGMARSLGSLGLMTCLAKSYSNELLIEFFNENIDHKYHTAMSIGSSQADFNNLEEVYNKTLLKYVCMDIANGYSQHFLDAVIKVRKAFPTLIIIAGNVVTREMTEALIFAGADIVKVGIGPGSVCTTRLVTGVGYPQLSAVIECADAAHGLGAHVIADGGCSTPGDVAKAFAAGADFVMLGGMLAGHDEGGGEIITRWYKQDYTHADGTHVIEAKQFVQFYGMSSKSANDKHFGGLKEYRASEGRTALVPYKGEVATTVQEILGGVRSACTYVGASQIKYLPKCTTFVRCTNTHNRTFEKSTIGN